MMTNIAMDTMIGAIPVVGDAFDFAFRANLKNLRIYEESLRSAHSANARHWGFFLVMFLSIAAVIGGSVFAIVELIRLI